MVRRRVARHRRRGAQADTRRARVGRLRRRAHVAEEDHEGDGVPRHGRHRRRRSVSRQLLEHQVDAAGEEGGEVGGTKEKEGERKERRKKKEEGGGIERNVCLY